MARGRGQARGAVSHLGIGREEVEGRDAEPELLRLGELPEAGAQ